MRNVLIAAAALAALAGSAEAKTAIPIDSAADDSYCLRSGGQPTFANGEWDKCLLPSGGERRATIQLPIRALADAALCSLAGGKVTMAHSDWDTCIIP
jgi:hypothetical protein